MDQQTDEWFAARIGKVTASRISDVMAKTKTGPSAMRANYMAELIAERLSGAKAETYTSAAMVWGNDSEAEARMAYEFWRNVSVETAGFVDHSGIKNTGASPDGLVGVDGLVEIKCPNTATHLATLLGGPIARQYLLQMQWQMACTGRQWCDFVSYDPRLPEAYRVHIGHVPRDASLIAEIETAVKTFLSELDSMEAQLRSKYEPQPILMAGE